MIMRIPLLRTVCKAIVAKADWDESKHPRADNGQFGSGSGGSSKPKKPSKTRRKMERREEAASQARVGGAIQSLLSGGSALDKIGWLKIPEKQPESEKPKAKPPAQKKPKLPSESDLIGTGVTDQNYREFLDRGIENLSRNEYIAAKQSQYYVEQNGKVLSTQAAAKLYDQEKVKPTEPAKRPNAVPTNEELDASGVYDQNYKDYLKKPPESLSLAEYVAAKQSQYYVERGDILSAETAADWYHAAVAEAAKKPATQSDIKVEDGEVAGSKILSLGNKRAGVMQHADGSFVVLSQVDRKTVDRKEFKHLDVANRYAEAWLKGGQGVPKQPEKPKAEEKPKSRLAQEMIDLGIKVPPPSKKIGPGSATLNLKTDSGVDIPLKVSGYKQNPEIAIDPPFTTKTGLRIAGSGQIISTKINGKPRDVLRVNTAKGPAMLTVDTAQIKGAADKLPEKQYAARKVKETINSDGIPIEVERWNIDGGSRTTSTGRYINDSELGSFLDSVGITDTSVKDAITLYEQLMETPEKLQRRKEREAASYARMQHFQDMEEMENMRGG